MMTHADQEHLCTDLHIATLDLRCPVMTKTFQRWDPSSKELCGETLAEFNPSLTENHKDISERHLYVT
jgi:hypothetical protein